MINPEVENIVEAELRRGEKLIWADKPYKFPVSFDAIFISGFSAVWLLLAMNVFLSSFFQPTGEPADTSAVVDATVNATPLFSFVLAATLFVVVGVIMLREGLSRLIGPSRELYAITNQRGIIISPFFGYRVASLTAQSLGNSERKGTRDKGSLVFNAPPTSGRTSFLNSDMSNLKQFKNIQNPKLVSDLIHETFFEKGPTP